MPSFAARMRMTWRAVLPLGMFLVLACLPPTRGFNEIQWFVDRVKRIEGDHASSFSKEIKAMIPHSVQVPDVFDMKTMMDLIVRSQCPKTKGADHKCLTRQLIWWFDGSTEAVVKVAKEVARLRKTSKLSGERDGTRRFFIIFSTPLPLHPPDTENNSPDSVFLQAKRNNMLMEEAMGFDAVLVYDQSEKRAYDKFTHLNVHFMHAWPKDQSFEGLPDLGNVAIDLPVGSEAAVIACERLALRSGECVDARDNAAPAPTSPAPALIDANAPTTRPPYGRKLLGMVDFMTRALGHRYQPPRTPVRVRYIGATCGTMKACKERDWSTLLMSLHQANEELLKMGKPQVTLKIAVRIDEILGKPDQSNLEAPPIQDCTIESHCELLSLSNKDFTVFVRRASIIANPLQAGASVATIRNVVLSALSRGAPVLTSGVPPIAGYVQHGKDGFVVPDGISMLQTVKAYKDAIVMLFSEPPAAPFTLKGLKMGAEFSAKHHYSVAGTIKELMFICRNFVNKNNPAVIQANIKQIVGDDDPDFVRTVAKGRGGFDTSAVSGPNGPAGGGGGGDVGTPLAEFRKSGRPYSTLTQPVRNRFTNVPFTGVSRTVRDAIVKDIMDVAVDMAAPHAYPPPPPAPEDGLSADNSVASMHDYTNSVLGGTIHDQQQTHSPTSSPPRPTRSPTFELAVPENATSLFALITGSPQPNNTAVTQMEVAVEAAEGPAGAEGDTSAFITRQVDENSTEVDSEVHNMLVKDVVDTMETAANKTMIAEAAKTETFTEARRSGYFDTSEIKRDAETSSDPLQSPSDPLQTHSDPVPTPSDPLPTLSDPPQTPSEDPSEDDSRWIPVVENTVETERWIPRVDAAVAMPITVNSGVNPSTGGGAPVLDVPDDVGEIASADGET